MILGFVSPHLVDCKKIPQRILIECDDEIGATVTDHRIEGDGQAGR